MALLVIFAGFAINQLQPLTANAAPNSSTISFQARLESSTGSIVPDGSYNIEYKLYNALTSSGSSQGSCTGDAACLWTEDYLNSASHGVSVVDGYLSVNLGSITSFPSTINWNQPVYLTMNIGGTSTGTPTWDGEMTPRLQLTAVPDAFQAQALQSTVGSYTSSLTFPTSMTGNDAITLPDATGTVCLDSSLSCGFAASTGSGGYIQNTTTSKTENFNIQAATGGSVAGILEAASSGSADILDLQNNLATNVFSVGYTGNTLIKTSTNSTSAFLVQGSTSIYALDVDTSNTRVGVGTNAPSTALDVEGNQNSQFALTLNNANTSSSATSAILLGAATTISQNSSTDTALGGASSLNIQNSTGPITLGVNSYLNETISATGATVFKNTSNSTAGFVVQNAGSIAILTTDTTNSRVVVGSGGTATAQLDVSGTGGTLLGATQVGSGGSEDTDEQISGHFLYIAGLAANKLYVYDVTNPSSPVAIGTPIAVTSPTGMALSGHYLYISNFSSSTMQVVDISNPYAPVVVGVVTLTSRPGQIAIVGRYAYIATQSGVDVVDIANPIKPIKVTNIATTVLSTSQLTAAGRYVYVDTTDNGTNAYMQAIDTTTNTIVGTYTLAGGSSANTQNSGGYYGMREMAVQGSYVYVSNVGNKTIDVFNVSNPAAGGAPVTSISTGSTLQPYSLSIQGRYLYANVSTALSTPAAFYTYDISTPASITQVGTGTTSTYASEGLTIQGRYAYASGYDGHLEVYDLGGSYIQQLEAGSTETSTLQVDNDANFNGNESVAGGVQIGQSLQVSGNLGVSGSVDFQNASNSTTALQVQNAAGTQVLNVNTTASLVTVQGTNSDAVIGSQLMTSTTNFSSGWTGTGWTFSSSSATHTTGTTPAVYSGFTPVAGTEYQITYTFASGSGNGTDAIKPDIGGVAGTYVYSTASTDTQIITTSTTASLEFIPTNSWTGVITSVSVKTVTSSNAVFQLLNSAGGLGIQVRVSTNDPIDEFIGYYAGLSNSTGNYDTGVGYDSLQDNTTGSNNAAFGDFSLQANSTGSLNSAFGDSALGNNTSGSDNSAFGQTALYNNNTGINNAAFGTDTLASNTSGSDNSAFGAGSQAATTSSFANTSIGYSSLSDNTTGGASTGVGAWALQDATGANNTAVGAYSMQDSGAATYDVAIGESALFDESGANDVGIGYNAGGGNGTYNDSAGSNNTYIGYETGPGTSTTISDATAIGAAAQVSESNAIVLGCVNGVNGCTTVNEVGIDTASPQTALDIEGNQNSQLALTVKNTNTGASSNASVLLGSLSSITQNSSGNTSGGGASSLNITNSGGNIQLSSSASTIVKPTANSTTAFQVQDASSFSMLNIDSSNDITSINGSALDVGSVANVGTPTVTNSSGGSLTTSTTYYYRVAAYFGAAKTPSLAASPSPTSNTGYNAYIINWSAVTGAAGYYLYRSSDGGNTFYRVNVGNVITATDNGSTYTFSGTNYASNATINSSSQINFLEGGYLNFNNDAETIGVSYSSGGGNIQLYDASGSTYDQSQGLFFQDTSNSYVNELSVQNGGQVLFQNGVNSTSALVVESSGGSPIRELSVDTTNNYVQIGSSTANSNGTLLVLNNASADPGTVVNGAMYYNSTDNSFRCGENGVWRSCVGGLANANSAASSALTAATSETNFASTGKNNYTVLANDCQAGVTYLITAQGTYTTTASTAASTVTFSLNEDGTTTILGSAGPQVEDSTAGTNTYGWQLTGQMICLSTTSVEVDGSVIVSSAANATSTTLIANTATKTWTTASHTLNVGLLVSATTGAPSYTMRQFIVQRTGP